jgi:hypothetical protein
LSAWRLDQQAIHQEFYGITGEYPHRAMHQLAWS